LKALHSRHAIKDAAPAVALTLEKSPLACKIAAWTRKKQEADSKTIHTIDVP
jgi:hypothetical protein